MRVLVLGRTGQVATELARAMPEATFLGRDQADLSDPAACAAAVLAHPADAVINAAAWTAVDKAEAEERAATVVNGEAPAAMARACADRGVPFLHVSTDYVFDGTGEAPFAPDHPTAPLGAYGRSKLAGERAVLAHPGHLVLRVSWVFGVEKPSFIDQVFDAALAGRPLAAVADKLSLPTCTGDLAQWVERLLDTDAEGLLHACNAGPAVSWHGMAEFVVREMAKRGVLPAVPAVEAQALAGMAAFRAPRPRFTAMDNSRLASLIGTPLRPWPEAMAEHVALRCASRCR